MNVRGAAAHGALAVGTLLAVYGVLNRPGCSGDGQVIVADFPPRAIEAIRYETPGRRVELQVRKVDGERQYWIIDEARAAAPKTTEYRGKKEIAELFAQSTPLRAARRLGKLSPQQRKDVGLDGDSARALTVKVAGLEHRCLLGSPNGPLAPPTYLEDPQGVAYLVDTSMSFSWASAPMSQVQTRLHELDRTDFDAVILQGNGREFEYLSTPSGDWNLAPKSAPEKRDGAFEAWHQGFFELPTTEVFAKGQLPTEGEPRIVGRVEYRRSGRLIGWVEIGEAAGAASFARSHLTTTWVRLSSRAQAIVDPMKKLLGI